MAIFGILSAIFPAFGGAVGGLMGFMKMQHGYEGWVSKPTLMLAGEAGPEYVSVRPQAQTRGGGNTLILNISAMDAKSFEDWAVFGPGGRVLGRAFATGYGFGR